MPSLGNRNSGDGVFVNDVTVIGLEDQSASNTYGNDLAIKVLYDNGRPGDWAFYLSGKYKRDELSNEVIDWGSCFTINMAFDNMGMYEGFTQEQKEEFAKVMDNGKIPEAFIEKAKSRTLKIQILSYKNSEGKSRTYKITGKYGDPIDKLLKKFENDEYVHKAKDESTAFPYGANDTNNKPAANVPINDDDWS
jgi:hypothetical protein